MKYVVIEMPRKTQAVDGVEGPQEAIEELKDGLSSGAYLAIPWEDWLVFEVESNPVVRPVPRASELPDPADEPEPGEPTAAMIDEDLEGMTQGPRR